MESPKIPGTVVYWKATTSCRLLCNAPEPGCVTHFRPNRALFIELRKHVGQGLREELQLLVKRLPRSQIQDTGEVEAGQRHEI